MDIQPITTEAMAYSNECQCHNVENTVRRVALLALGTLSAALSLTTLGLTMVSNPIWLVPSMLFGGAAMLCFAEVMSEPACPLHHRVTHTTVIDDPAPTTTNVVCYNRRPWYQSVWPLWRRNVEVYPRRGYSTPPRTSWTPAPTRAPVGHRAPSRPAPAPRTTWTPAPTRAPVGQRMAPSMPAPTPMAPRAPVGRAMPSAPRAAPTPVHRAPEPRPPAGNPGMRAAVGVRR